MPSARPLAALRAWDPVLGLVVGSYQGCSEALHGLAREAAKAKATGRQMGVRSVHEALGIYTHDVHRRWGSVFWRSWARAIRPRPPARHWAAERRHPSPRPAARVRTLTAERLLAGPRRACAAGRQVQSGGARAVHARRQACERRAAGWRVSAEPTMLRLNSHFLGF